jgi:hypothetical protein
MFALSETAAPVASAGAVGEPGRAHPANNAATHIPTLTTMTHSALMASPPSGIRRCQMRGILSAKRFAAHGGKMKIF